ncbi:MAG: hypothetical protein JWO58_1991 [Chitinophagaceae bacterium]|nr:hypothetical protein [Chitinophagaceae bacterium]
MADRNAYVQSGASTPTPGQLLVNANAPNNIMQAYVSFDISFIRTSNFNNAFLYVRAYDMVSYPNTTLFAYSTDTTWDESSISWATQPAASPVALNSTVIYDLNQQWYKIDVSSFILGERNAGHTRASFLLNDTVSINNPLPFYSRTTAYPPLLVLNNKRGGCTGYTYQWQSSLFCNNTWSDIASATSLSYTAPAGLTDSTCYRLQVTDACSSVVYSNTLHINIDAQTVAGTLTVTEADPSKGTIQVGGAVGKVLHWEVSEDDFATVNTALNSTSAQISYTGSTTSDLYYRALIRSGVCSQLYTDTVKILKVQDFTIFNSFSPNGDGLNDVWKINGIERYPDNKVSIVNFMGVPVYEASHYNNEDVVWDGHGGGQSLPDGTYYYSIQIPDKPSLTGFVVIKR